MFVFKSKFKPSLIAKSVLIDGKILGTNEKPNEMVERVTNALFDIENKFKTSKTEIEKFKKEFGHLLDNKFIVMSTPIMHNAGRFKDKPLSACTLPPINLSKNYLAEAKNIIEKTHADGMGTGFDLDSIEDPVAMLEYLNKIAIDGALSGNEDRPVGNMAVLSVHHPKITDFIYAKSKKNKNKHEWKFNISINITENFMQAVKNNLTYSLFNGQKIKAKPIMKMIADAAHNCGDPGLIFMERLNQDNPTPDLGLYTSTAPCAEVGLIPGEACQFGYINLSKYITKNKNINYQKLNKTARLMTRTLDNALEISLNNYPHPLSKKVMTAKRKIGIGICGLADMLIELGIPYDSKQARIIALETIIFINYYSKIESYELAKIRGSFTAINLPNCQYIKDPTFLVRKYGQLSTSKISNMMWIKLAQKIKETKLLRNASTTSLPPTGRSALVIDASTGIEPLFSLVQKNRINKYLMVALKKEKSLNIKLIVKKIKKTGTIPASKKIPENIINIFKTALEIHHNDHLLMAAELQKVVDESISKTINLTRYTSPQEIYNIYLKAYELGLKGISIFRNGSKDYHPYTTNESLFSHLKRRLFPHN